jgi:hypothetical protein
VLAVIVVVAVVALVAVAQVRRRGSRLMRPDNAPGPHHPLDGDET